MKTTIKRLAEHVIDLGGDVGIEAEALDDGDTIAAARCALLLLRAQKAMNRARDAIRAARQAIAESRQDNA